MNDQQETRVWVIEDNVLFRESLVISLDETPGLACSAYASCEEAIQNLRAGAPPHLILMDIELEGMSGIEGTALIHKEYPDIQIIMLTIHQDSDRVFEAICAGASGYLLKPSSIDTLIEAVEEVLAGGSPINGQIARKLLRMFRGISPTPQADYGLTPRETEVLEKLVDGHTKKEIADLLFVSEHTINTHVRSIYDKLHVHSRAGAVAKAVREKLI